MSEWADIAFVIAADGEVPVDDRTAVLQRYGRVVIATVADDAAYEIRAVGDVPSELLDDFEGATVSVDPGGVTIHVVLGDDAELHGLLAALSREGFALVDVRRETDV